MRKIFSKKLMYIIAVLAVLAMMVPMSIPVSAANETVVLTTINTAEGWDNDSGYNVYGAVVRAAVSDQGAAIGFTAAPVIGGASVVNADETNHTWVDYTAYAQTEVNISAALAEPSYTTPTVNKKWGSIASTTFSGFTLNGTTTSAGTSSYVTWNEGEKEWVSPHIYITDTVTGSFNMTTTPHATTHVAQGAILHWYLLDGTQTIDMAAAEANPSHAGDHALKTDLMYRMDSYRDARFTTFDGALAATPHYITTVTNALGQGTVSFSSTGEESVKIVVVQEYPGDPQLYTTPEVITYNFKTREMEVVPQVRWAGEKIVLEANFGDFSDNYTNDNASYVNEYMVKFSLPNGSSGTLNALEDYGPNVGNTTTTVWAPYNHDSHLFSVILENQNQGQVDVDASLYVKYGNDDYASMDNQQAFTVFFLKLEELVLSQVEGKRVLYNNTTSSAWVTSHKDGMWTPSATVWESSLDSTDNVTLPVSQDGLLRARVKGWFTNSNPTMRPSGQVDTGGTYPLLLPEGRYVLPDDWATLAGPTNRIHWDIMSDPSEADVTAHNVLGPYEMGGNVVADSPVIGPFAPGIEVMTDTGWAVAMVSEEDFNWYHNPADHHNDRLIKTVVPDGLINEWDAPMPPAKIIFEIQKDSLIHDYGVGFFKDAFKDTIYYLDTVVSAQGPNGGFEGQGPNFVYTNPFYYANIPAHWAIPPTTANGGYDWDSFDFNTSSNGEYGPYEFWEFINQPDGAVTPEDASMPTKVEVYSDNHGEAMVYINGDANLNLSGQNGGADIDYLEPVGSTTVQAWADYPYARKHQAIYSETVTYNWEWYGQILGPSNGDGAPMILVAGTDDEIELDSTQGYSFPLDEETQADAEGASLKHVVWIWVTDRDGMQAGVLDAQVDWLISGSGTKFWDNGDGDLEGINTLGPISDSLVFDKLGFLKNDAHPGVREDRPVYRLNATEGTSWLRAPNATEKDLFLKFWPTLDPNNFAVSAIDVISSSAGEVHIDQYITSTDYRYGDFSDGRIRRWTDFNVAYSYPLDDPIILGDANLDGVVNMMDITTVERIILGMEQGQTVQSDANYNGVIDMGDVIRIEKTYLGLN